MMKQFIIFIGIVLFLLSCGPGKKELENKIVDLENKVKQEFTTTLPTKSIEELINLYDKYIEEYEDDSLTPKYIYKAAQYSMAINNVTAALKYYEMLYEKYSKHPKAPEALFMQAFIYENQLNNLPKAKELYQNFIAKYYDNPLARSAQFALDNLGKTPEQLAREFELKNSDKLDSIEKN